METIKKKEKSELKREYKVELTESILGCESLLDEMGENGWELVSMETSTKITFGNIEAIVWVFKRPY